MLVLRLRTPRRTPFQDVSYAGLPFVKPARYFITFAQQWGNSTKFFSSLHKPIGAYSASFQLIDGMLQHCRTYWADMMASKMRGLVFVPLYLSENVNRKTVTIKMTRKPWAALFPSIGASRCNDAVSFRRQFFVF